MNNEKKQVEMSSKKIERSLNSSEQTRLENSYNPAKEIRIESSSDKPKENAKSSTKKED